ncbi:MAG: inositol monophosphatase family protein [Synechococcaceae cyanobacterium]|nr:inositol monophosphatase family protein [Synechococcaceae cyanobacterium]
MHDLSLSAEARRDCGLPEGELERLAGVARRAAAAGAEPLRRLFGQLENIRAKGTAGNLVTEADLAAEAAVLAVLEAETPRFPVLAEESGRRRGEGELEWCVDPLDGTTNYAHGFPVFASSVGLLWRGLPLLGALELPALEQSFWAAAGHGAWRNGARLQVSACSEVADALLGTGFAYDRTSRRDNNYAEFALFTHRSHGVRRAGAAAVDLAWVAAGALDGYWERGLSPWDLAAGVVLVEEAGGVVSAYDGSRLSVADGRLIACAPGLHRPMVEALASCRPLAGSSYGAPELDREGSL